MIIIAAVDDNMGMMFNHRRVSQDKLLRKRICEICNGRILYMTSYSASQFTDEDLQNIIITEADDISVIVGSDDYVFVENIPMAGNEKKINKIILYRWNRLYPSDFKFDISFNRFILISSVDFVGNSHERITEEVYIKNEE